MQTAPTIKHPDLYAEIMAFCAARGVAKTRFGKDALRDPAFIATVEAGRELRRDTIEAVRRYMVTGVPANSAEHGNTGRAAG